MTASQLPIKRLTLYKHGVSFVEREGEIQAHQVQLVFRRYEMNDALKSLLVIDRSGGAVHGIHYETPTGASAGRIQLSPDHSLLDLLRNLRGRQVRLSLGENTTAQTLSGILVGVEVDPEQPLVRSMLTLLEAGENSRVNAIALTRLSAVELLEGRAAEDLLYFLDSSRNDEGHRTVTLQLDGEDHFLTVSYLIPSPAWRVTYRLVAERTAGAEGGELLLQGWGLFDNHLEEDLEAVQVKLVAGQPISFVYDLATSEIPPRPIVQEESRVAPGPVEFEGLTVAGGGGMPPSGRPQPVMAFAAAAPMGISRASAELKPLAVGKVLGELFQYEVSVPVTVKRGESALVPILSKTISYRRALLYNGLKLPTHPVAALEFTNATGLVLERGPVTLIEDGEYRGEAVVPFTPDSANLYLAYAVELGIKVTEQQSTTRETVGLSIRGAYFQLTTALTTTTTYQIENNLGESRTVTIEQPVRPESELVSPAAADEMTGGHYRWRVACTARAMVRFNVQERQYSEQTQLILDQDYDALRRYLERRWLDEATFARLSDLLSAHRQIARDRQELESIEPERGELYRRQEQLRQNLTVLSAQGAEAQLRARLLGLLTQSEERLEALDGREVQLKQAIESTRQVVEASLASLDSNPDS